MMVGECRLVNGKRLGLPLHKRKKNDSRHCTYLLLKYNDIFEIEMYKN